MLQIEYHNLLFKKKVKVGTLSYLIVAQCQKAEYIQGPLEFDYLHLTCVKYSHCSCFKWIQKLCLIWTQGKWNTPGTRWKTRCHCAIWMHCMFLTRTIKEAWFNISNCGTFKIACSSKINVINLMRQKREIETCIFFLLNFW